MAEVIIYNDMSYQGKSQQLGVGRYDMSSISNDQVSSIRIPAGLKVTLFENAGFSGGSRAYVTDVNWVGNDFNDKASSIVVEPTPGFPFIDEGSKPGGTYNHGAPDSWLYNAVNNWMAYLPDSQLMKSISIPGTHDSATAGRPQLGVQTNSWSIKQQLEAGIRFMDIRTRRVGTGLTIHHGAFYLNTTFDDVMNTVKDFLLQQPKEAIIMRINTDEHEAEPGSQDFMTIWNNYTKKYNDVFAKVTSKNPTLGSLRGKVFVLAAGFTDSQRGIADGSDAFDIQNLYRVYWTPGENDYDFGESKASLPGKTNVVNQFLNKAATSPKWVLNYLSGSTGMTPKDVARAINGSAYAYMGASWGKRNTGLVVMDFPGEQLVYRIIKSNFSSQKKYPAQTFRCQSDHSWVEFRLPEGTEGQLIEIPGGAYNHYVFPKCNRVRWSNLAFLCTATGWQRTRGDWDADGLCDGSPGSSPYVVVGDR